MRQVFVQRHVVHVHESFGDGVRLAPPTRRVVRRQHDPRALGVGRDSGLVAHRAEHVRGFFPSSRLAKHHQDGGVRVHVTRFARVAHVAPHLVRGGPILAPTQRRDGGGGNLVRAHLVRLESRRVAPTFHDDARVATIGRRAEQTHQRVSIRAVLLGARAAPRVHPKIQRVRAIESAAFAQFLDGEVERGGGKFGDVRHRRVDGTTRGSNAIGRRRVARVAIVGAGITRPGVAALGRDESAVRQKRDSIFDVVDAADVSLGDARDDVRRECLHRLHDTLARAHAVPASASAFPTLLRLLRGSTRVLMR